MFSQNKIWKFFSNIWINAHWFIYQSWCPIDLFVSHGVPLICWQSHVESICLSVTLSLCFVSHHIPLICLSVICSTDFFCQPDINWLDFTLIMSHWSVWQVHVLCFISNFVSVKTSSWLVCQSVCPNNLIVVQDCHVSLFCWSVMMFLIGGSHNTPVICLTAIMSCRYVFQRSCPLICFAVILTHWTGFVSHNVPLIYLIGIIFHWFVFLTSK